MENNKKIEIIERLDKIERYSLLAAKNVLTLDDVEILTGLSKSYLYRLTSTKQIPYYKPNGKLTFFDRKEVEEWLKQNRIESKVDAIYKAANYNYQKGGKQ